MSPSRLQIGVLLLCPSLGAAATLAQSPHAAHSTGEASITGVIRDAEGIPQMGALVEALLPDATTFASAITDARGRYHLSIQTGTYRIRATAALLLPAVRERLLVGRGGHAVVDLTMATLLTTSTWLPATRRTPDEPGDDWMWTLRSSASRPILRYADVSDADAGDTAETVSSSSRPLAVSSSRAEMRRGAAGGNLTVREGDAGFSRGGSHQVLSLTRVNEDGSGAVVRADFSGARTPFPVAPSAEISAGYEKRSVLGGYTRSTISYMNHPELTDRNRTTGLQAAVLRSGQRMQLGDAVRVDVGSVIRDVNFAGNTVRVEPFLQVSARPTDGVVFSYSYSASAGTNSLDDLDRIQAALPLAVRRARQLRIEHGSHHAVTGAGRLPGGGLLQVSAYRESHRDPLISGTGLTGTMEMDAEGVLTDPTTGTLRAGARSYQSSGLRGSVRQPITKSVAISLDAVNGQALVSHADAKAALREVLQQTEATKVYAVTLAADGKFVRTGSAVRASYRWQPIATLTGLDGYQSSADGAYLSCQIRQTLRIGHLLPAGLQAIANLQNLLGEGYQPFVSNDGQTLYLAQTARSLQAGLSFTF